MPIHDYRCSREACGTVTPKLFRTPGNVTETVPCSNCGSPACKLVPRTFAFRMAGQAGNDANNAKPELVDAYEEITPDRIKHVTDIRHTEPLRRLD